MLLAAVLAGNFLVPAQAAEPLPAPDSEQLPAEARVAEIRILGNDTIDTAQIAGQLKTKVGRRFNRGIVQQDVRQLGNLNWFVDVKSFHETTPQGKVVIFQVVERPTIRYVAYVGNDKMTDKRLAKETALESGGAVDPYAVEEGRRKIKELYHTFGFHKVQVTILDGSEPTDQGIVYLINEGVAQKVWDVTFIGNQFVSDSRLETIVKSKPSWFKVNSQIPGLNFKQGALHREQLKTDVEQLTAYYRSFGFFQAKVSRKIEFNDKGNWAYITFIVDEGPRYNVRNVRFLGNTKFDGEAMAEAAKLTAGQPFEQSKVQLDTMWLQELYGSHGYVFADVRPEPVFLEEPGEVDLLYHIDEGEQFRVGRIFVNIGGENPHTRVQVALNRLSLRPGDIMDIRELKASERRLLASSLFHADAATGVRPKITYRIPEDDGLGLPGAGGQRVANGKPRVRGQSPDNLGPPVLPPPGAHTDSMASHQARSASQTLDGEGMDVHVHCESWEHYQRWLEGEQQLAGEDQQPTAQAEQETIIRQQSPDSGQYNSAYSSLPTGNTNAAYGGTLVGATGPNSSRVAVQPANVANPSYQQLTTPQQPYQQQVVAQQGYQQQVAPQQGYQQLGYQQPVSQQPTAQPVQYTESIAPPAGGFGTLPGLPGNAVPGYQFFPNGDIGLPGQPYPLQTVDIFVDGQETQTGRLMLGAGINSDAGLVGNIVIDERNFDWRRYPTSFEDVRNGLAWRGGGQRLRIDASPGSQVNRYLVSFTEPYLLDSPVSLSLGGSFFDRRFNNWDEQRLGGRIALGYKWVERDLSTVLTYRGEKVNISDAPLAFDSTSGDVRVPELAEVLGNNYLHGFRASVINDTRDSTFLATQGHYLEVSGEQVIGTFDYPRVMIDARKYFLIHERPDHSGRHVLTMSTNIGYSGTQTPIYEHFFAGGFSTIRGFDFRGASPIDPNTNAEIGGHFQWLNSVQYLFPITADDMLHGVVFCDFGTVERDVEIEDFRVAPGFGLRVNVPAMGPAPIALDFAFPVAYADFDDRQIFSFNMGFNR